MSSRDKIYDGPAICGRCSICAEQCPMKAVKTTRLTLHLDDKTVHFPDIERHRCDWAKRYSLCAQEGPALIGNKTDVKPPGTKITIGDIAAACEKKDPVMLTRTCILEQCIRHCPAGSKLRQQKRTTKSEMNRKDDNKR